MVHEDRMFRRDTRSDDSRPHERRDAQDGRIFNAKGIGQNVLLTAAAGIVPLLIVGVASFTSLANRRKVRLPRF